MNKFILSIDDDDYVYNVALEAENKSLLIQEIHDAIENARKKKKGSFIYQNHIINNSNAIYAIESNELYTLEEYWESVRNTR